MSQFEVTVPGSTPAQETRVVVVEAFHWHTAFKEAFANLGEDAPGQLMFDISDDEAHIRITDTQNNRVIEIVDLSSVESDEAPAPEALSEEDAGATILAIPAFADEDIGPPPIPAELSSAPTSLELGSEPEQPASSSLTEEERQAILARHPAISLTSGVPTVNLPEELKETSQYLVHGSEAPPSQYQGAGMTTEILADAFMRAMDIYDYGDDRNAAMQFVLELALDQLDAQGAGVLLTDHNSAVQELWYEIAAGDAADTLLNLRIPVGQGAVGKSVRDGSPMNIVNLKANPEFANDHLLALNIDVGPIVISPIQHSGRVFGALLLYRWSFGQPYTAGESSILNYLAHTAGEYFSSLIS